jgi:hypothetical protein
MMRKIQTAGLSDHRLYHITKPEVGSPRHNNESVLLFLVIATVFLLPTTLSVLTIIMMINAQGTSGDNNNKASSGTDKQQMGICVVGAKSPCNGDRNSPT